MAEDHTNELRDIAFRKLGRNLVNFQRFERMLKLAIVQSDVRGYASKLAQVHRQRTKDTKRKPLGWLVEEFFTTIYSNELSDEGQPKELDEVWMNVFFRIDADIGSIRNRKRELLQLVKERNWLIHTSVAELDFKSAESCEKLISQLDEQDDRLTPHYQYLMRLVGDIQEKKQELAKQLETHLRRFLLEGGDSA